jgi:hypothetical protein
MAPQAAASAPAPALAPTYTVPENNRYAPNDSIGSLRQGILLHLSFRFLLFRVPLPLELFSAQDVPALRRRTEITTTRYAGLPIFAVPLNNVAVV